MTPDEHINNVLRENEISRNNKQKNSEPAISSTKALNETTITGAMHREANAN